MAWVAALAGTDEVEVVYPLAGSSTGELHVLRLGTGRGEAMPAQVVLRRYTRPELVARYPAMAEREAIALRAVADTGLAAPRLLAVDPDGADAGVPALLMTLLDGVPVLQPGIDVPHEAWLDGLVETLAQVHGATPGTALEPIEPWFGEADDLVVPSWAQEATLWWALFDELTEPMPTPTSPSLVHRDLHPANLLWHDGRVTGIVDWLTAGIGSAAADLARCRTNLAILTGEPDADDLLARYGRRVGAVPADQRWWDLADIGGCVRPDRVGPSMLEAIATATAQLGVPVGADRAASALEGHLRAVLG